LSGRPGGWRIRGSVEVLEDRVPARLRYLVECDSEWRTRSAAVEGEIPGESVTMALRADGRGRWTGEGVNLPHLDGVLDVDFGFTPATNTLPIRRLKLRVGETAPVTTAWLRFPELRVERLEQSYTREAEDVYRYRAVVDGAEFSALLQTDQVGVVRRYEGLWEIDATASRAATDR
jgi:hypothetical protein